MERKYYLRGLGLGIVVTGVIMGIVSSKSKAMTDSEIIARAKELGMVENTVLSEINKDETESSSETEEFEKSGGTEEENKNMEPEVSDLTDLGAVKGDEEGLPETSEEEQADPTEITGVTEGDVNTDRSEDPTMDSTDLEKDQQEENTNDVIVSATVKTITVNSGDGSHTVAKKLADAGVVTSADDFDTFLCQYGYDKKLRTGTFLIPADASDEQIARIVTGIE